MPNWPKSQFGYAAAGVPRSLATRVLCHSAKLISPAGNVDERRFFLIRLLATFGRNTRVKRCCVYQIVSHIRYLIKSDQMASVFRTHILTIFSILRVSELSRQNRKNPRERVEDRA